MYLVPADRQPARSAKPLDESANVNPNSAHWQQNRRFAASASRSRPP